MTISIEERKAKRKEVLKEIYNHYFENGGTAYKVIKQDLLNDREKELALLYLEEKRLIRIDKQGNTNFFIKATAYGIDEVENS